MSIFLLCCREYKLVNYFENCSSSPSDIGYITQPMNKQFYSWLHIIEKLLHKKFVTKGFPGGPMAKYLPSSVGITGSIPAQVTEILHDAGQCPRAHAIRFTFTLQQRPSGAKIIFFRKEVYNKIYV